MKQYLKEFPGLYREVSDKRSPRFRILINHGADVIQEYFYFGTKVSEAAARKAAIERWREIRKEVPVLTKRKFRELARKTTASGVAGVTRITTKRRGHEYDVWKANWTACDGTRGSRQFSVNKYGEWEAMRLAIQKREEELDKIEAA